MTKNEAIGEANAICRRAERKSGRLGDLPVSDPAAARSYSRRLRTIFEEMADDLTSVVPPKAERHIFDRHTAALAEIAALGRSEEQALAQGDQARVTRTVAQRFVLLEEADRAARRYGLDDCLS